MHGGWEDKIQKESSNFREAHNLILGVEEALRNGELKEGTELFVFTDNKVAESSFNSGSGKSKLLHELVKRLRKCMMLGKLIVHFVWIAGRRMIAQGTDSLSRGDVTSGVMRGEDFLDFIPLNKIAFQRLDVLRPWLLDALPKEG